MCLFLKPQSQIDKVLLSPDQSVDRFRMRLSSGVGDLFTTKRFNDTKLTRWHCCFSLTPPFPPLTLCSRCLPELLGSAKKVNVNFQDTDG